MISEAVTIIDGGRNLVATAMVAIRKDCYSGSVDLSRMSAPLRALFEEYEEIVNNQVFSRLDQVEDHIGDIPFSAVFDDGRESRVQDLQIFPGGGTVSFRVVEPAMIAGRR